MSIITTQAALSAFLTLRSLFLFKDCSASGSFDDRLFLGCDSLISVSCNLSLQDNFRVQPRVELVVSSLILRDKDVVCYFAHERYILGAFFSQIAQNPEEVDA